MYGTRDSALTRDAEVAGCVVSYLELALCVILRVDVKSE